MWCQLYEAILVLNSIILFTQPIAPSSLLHGNINSSRVITRVINLIWEKGDFSGKKPMISAVRLGLSLQHCNLASLGLWNFINCGSKTGQRDFFLNWMNGRLYLIVICTGCWIFKGGILNWKFLVKNQHWILRIGVVSSGEVSKKCQNLISKVNFLCQKSSESLWFFFHWRIWI